MSNPPPILSRTRLLQCVKFDIERISWQTSAGPVQREIVVHPGSVVVLPLLDDGRVLMIRNYRFSIERTLWELPAGTLGSAEEPLSCAARELEEETGYVAAQLTPLIAFYAAPGICTEYMVAFLATGLRPTSQRLEVDEAIEVVPLAWERVLELLARGEIADAKSIATLLHYHVFNAVTAAQPLPAGGRSTAP